MKQAGFTLIELLIALAIVSILAAIAVPAYSQFLARGEMRVAQADLELASVVLENRYQRVLSYPQTAASSTQELILTIPQWNPSADSLRFKFTNIDPAPERYTVVATGLHGQYKDCVISLTHDGVKSITNCPKLAPDGSWL